MDTTKTQLDPEIREPVESAAIIPREDVQQAFDRCAALRPMLDQVAANYSTLITPNTADEAPLRLGDIGDANFNFVWTVSSLDLSSLPTGRLTLSRQRICR
jgi:hypothetical protein